MAHATMVVGELQVALSEEDLMNAVTGQHVEHLHDDKSVGTSFFRVYTPLHDDDSGDYGVGIFAPSNSHATAYLHGFIAQLQEEAEKLRVSVDFHIEAIQEGTFTLDRIHNLAEEVMKRIKYEVDDVSYDSPGDFVNVMPSDRRPYIRARVYSPVEDVTRIVWLGRSDDKLRIEDVEVERG